MKLSQSSLAVHRDSVCGNFVGLLLLTIMSGVNSFTINEGVSVTDQHGLPLCQAMKMVPADIYVMNADGTKMLSTLPISEADRLWSPIGHQMGKRLSL